VAYSFIFLVDDRFILKQMKKAEVESFVEIADGYFNHLRKAFEQNVTINIHFATCHILLIPSMQLLSFLIGQNVYVIGIALIS